MNLQNSLHYTMKDHLNWALSRQHPDWDLNRTLLQGSQTQTPLEAELNEARTKTTGTDGNLELENLFCFLGDN